MEQELKKKVIQSEEFKMIESRRYNVSVSIKHHQDLKKMLSSEIKQHLITFLNPDYGLFKPKR